MTKQDSTTIFNSLSYAAENIRNKDYKMAFNYLFEAKMSAEKKRINIETDSIIPPFIYKPIYPILLEQAQNLSKQANEKKMNEFINRADYFISKFYDPGEAKDSLNEARKYARLLGISDTERISSLGHKIEQLTRK